MPHVFTKLLVVFACLVCFTLSGVAAPITVPFELHNNHIYLSTMVNGKGPYYFLFDSGAGASGSAIDGELAASLKLAVEGELNASMIGGSRGLSFTGGVTYDIGGLRFEEKRTAFFPLKAQEKEEHHRIDGIFGYSLIRKHVIAIDYRRHTLTFYAPSEYKKPANAVALPLNDLDKAKVPIVNAALLTRRRDHLDLPLTIDTGYDGSLLLGRQFVLRNHLESDASASRNKPGSGLGGSTSLRPGRVGRLTLGRVTIPEPATIFAFDEEGKFSGNNGYIGGQLLRKFSVVFNYPEGYMLLLPK